MKIAALLLNLALASARFQFPSPQPNFTPADLGGFAAGLSDNSTEHALERRACESGYGRCRNTGYCCPTESECCVDGCGPAGSQCCRSGGHCDAGNNCYIFDGEQSCCTNSYCTAYVDGSGYTTTATQTFTYDITITYYTYYYYDATILESDYQYFYTTYYIYATATAEASSSIASIRESLEASLSAEYTPPPSPTLPVETSSDSFSSYTPPSDDPIVPNITPPPRVSLPSEPSFSAVASPSSGSDSGSGSGAVVCVGCPGDLCSRCGEDESGDGSSSTTGRRSTVVFPSAPTIPIIAGIPQGAATSIKTKAGGESVLALAMAAAAFGVGTVMLML